MENRKILFIKLSANLSLDAKKFIGTTLVSSLVHAVLSRDKLSEEKRHQFCIFVDEVQNFTTSDDFAVLFTQARKFGIATTIAHQERYGQLLENRKILGATSAAGNKVIFQVTPEDARELAPEFANEPPTEEDVEWDAAISHEPIADLLRRGHKHSVIQEFTYRFLRRRSDHLKNIKEQFSQMHLKRLGYMDEATIARDEASIYQADARIGSANVRCLLRQWVMVM
jgi:Type IV secretion-system coupling protein DNA-binding domain